MEESMSDVSFRERLDNYGWGKYVCGGTGLICLSKWNLLNKMLIFIFNFLNKYPENTG